MEDKEGPQLYALVRGSGQTGSKEGECLAVWQGFPEAEGNPASVSGQRRNTDTWWSVEPHPRGWEQTSCSEVEGVASMRVLFGCAAFAFPWDPH